MIQYPAVCLFRMLGLPYGASTQDCKNAFHRKLFIHHPDRKAHDEYKEFARRVKASHPPLPHEEESSYLIRIQAKMDAITLMVMLAGEVLTKEDSYDAYIAYRKNASALNKKSTSPHTTALMSLPLQCPDDDPASVGIYDYILGNVVSISAITIRTNGVLYLHEGFIVTYGATHTTIEGANHGKIEVLNADIEPGGLVYCRIRDTQTPRGRVVINSCEVERSEINRQGYLELLQQKHAGANLILKPPTNYHNVIRALSTAQPQIPNATAREALPSFY